MTKKLMLGAALSALMISGALAQAPAPQPTNATPPAAAGSSGAGDKFVMSQKPDQYLASKFKGTDVLGSDNKKIGDVTDILFDKNGKIDAYVVSVGGFLGMGAKDVALAPSAFEVMPGDNGAADKLKLSMTQDQLKQAENFTPYSPPHAATTGAGPAGGGLGGGLGGPAHPPGGAGR
jgi:hypothetical protein